MSTHVLMKRHVWVRRLGYAGKNGYKTSYNPNDSTKCILMGRGLTS